MWSGRRSTKVVRGTTDCRLCRKAEEHEKGSHRFPSALRSRQRRSNVKLVYSRCAGLDVHKKTISVCVRQGNGNKLQCVSDRFGTFTGDLERLSDFLLRNKVNRVVMESTGVYWIPAVECAGTRQPPISVGVGQSTACPRFTRTQDRSEGLRTVGRTWSVRSVALQFHSASAHSRTPRSHTVAHASSAGPQSLNQPNWTVAGNRQHQVEFGGYRYRWHRVVCNPRRMNWPRPCGATPANISAGYSSNC